MKKISLSMMALILILTGCSTAANSDQILDGQSPSAQQPPVAPEVVVTEDPIEIPPVKPSFVVSIDGHSLDENYKKEPVLIVEYGFTNNSSTNVSFIKSVHAQAFQNGVELRDSAMFDIMRDNPIDDWLPVVDVKPGVTVQVKVAYTMRNLSPVEIEVYSLHSSQKGLIVSETIAF